MKLRVGSSAVLGVLKVIANPTIVDSVEGIEVIITTVDGSIHLCYLKSDIRTLSTNNDGAKYMVRLVSEILSKPTNCLNEQELDEYIKRVLTSDVSPCEQSY